MMRQTDARVLTYDPPGPYAWCHGCMRGGKRRVVRLPFIESLCFPCVRGAFHAYAMSLWTKKKAKAAKPAARRKR